MSITAEELARDKAGAERDAKVWGGLAMANWPRDVLKYITEVERLHAEVVYWKENAEGSASLIVKMSATSADKDAEIARLKEALRVLRDDHCRVEPHHEDMCAICRQADATLGLSDSHRSGGR